ncbi:hypothetical protein POSPLADRAFT_1043275 [Postia placenta MAD-698-R-SB12]|uniref:ABC transporter domain-containing protein n=1 Tax=Postia placenta MAD-698-R-SB12 TaxID=670580 RepID=A0A1X6NHQ8_9APHY|nr:hypothetical protein POSPLADRAFT_1043275 [Postia placenta MAD-698-R-SB12]OSX68144.1 hypothetical protein POSPLADRAFT_1043275 [Postia placenta MAD-698-R-SB12]
MTEDPQGTLWDTRFIPVYIAAISLVVLLLENLYQLQIAKRLCSNLIALGAPSLSSGSVVFDSDSAYSRELRAPPSLSRRFICLNAEYEDRTESVRQPASLEIALCGTYAYVSLLSLATLVARPKTSGRVTRYLVLILLSAWAVYAYRDIWPYATFDLTPLDASEGIYLWTKITFLTLAAVLVPLFSPRRIPSSSLLMHTGTPLTKQTASLASLVFFTWIDPIVFKAYRVPHLSVDELPPLADYDDSESLVNSYMKELDPLLARKKGQHVGWGLVKVFRNDFIVMGIMLTLHVIARFANPMGVRNLLAYLEGSSDTTVRPWVWVAWLFVGPIFTVMSISMYIFYGTRMLVRLEALVTQLVFSHALRMRVKSDVAEMPAPKASAASTVAPGGEGTSSTPGVQNSSIDSAKGKQRASSDALKQAQLGTGSQKSKNLVGKINNLITTDLQSLATGRDILRLFVMVPVQTLLCIWFLYSVLGWSAFVGMAVIVLLLPVPGSVAKMIRGVQVEKMKKTDTRVQGVTEAMNVIRMIKLFGWERRITDQLTEKREVELKSVKRARFLQMISSSLTIEGVLIDDRPVFEMFTMQLNEVFSMLPLFIRAKVSLDRLNEFLQTTELLDEFEEQQEAHASASMLKNDVPSDVIGFRDATFTWTAEDSLSSSTGTHKPHHWTYWVGEDFTPNGTVSHDLFDGAGKENILFGAALDEERYNKGIINIIKQCGLERDLELFDAGDLTEVGEKGITLRYVARVTLARAVYSKAEILLLDDILAALDVHTAHHIMEHCLKGDLIRGRTILLVTHNVALATPVAGFIVAMGTDGRVSSQGSLSDALEDVTQLAKDIVEERQAAETAEDVTDKIEVSAKASKSGKLVVAEEIAIGHVGLKSMKLYFSNLGGKHYVMFWLLAPSILVFSEIIRNLQVWWLGYWARQYEERAAEEVSAPFYLSIYGLLLSTTVLLITAFNIFWIFATLRASRAIHKSLIASVFTATLRLDGSIKHPPHLGAVVITSPLFLTPGIIIALAGGYIGHIFMKAQLSVKREMSNARAPVLGHIGSAFSGLVSIRAFGAQQAYKKASWVCIRLEALSALFTASLAAYLVYASHDNASNIGFALNMAVGFSSLMLSWVRMLNETEVNAWNAFTNTWKLNTSQHLPKTDNHQLTGQPVAISRSSNCLLYDDAVMNNALRSAGLFSLQNDMTEGQITLDSPIASGGGNLSVGQKQILALARAILRQSKLLILDEDYETDAVIQASLRTELDKSVTILTVAHRLQTIMDSDRIMVLDAGRIVEFGKPSDLLSIEGGLLRALVDESGDKDKLYAMAVGDGPH